MKKLVQYCAIALALLAAAVYLNSLWNGFVSDDRYLIFEHPFTKNVADWPKIFTAGHYAGNGGYRPLTTLSFALNYFAGRNNPIGYHAVNILLHALNTALVFLLLRRLLRSLSIALVAGAIFAVHPIHTEAVAWISGRAELLCGFFFLAAWLLHLKSTRAENSSAVPVAGSLLLFFTALLSKENALVFPIAVIMGDVLRARTILDDGKRAWKLSTTKLSILYGAYVGVIGFYFVFRSLLYSRSILRAATQVQFVDNPLAHSALVPRILTALKIQGDYLALLFWPGRLCGDYSFNSVPLVHDWSTPEVLVPMAAMSVLLALAGIAFVRRWSVWFGIVFYFLAILPVTNFLTIIGTIKAERLLYLPSLGFCAAAAAVWEVWQTPSRKRIQEDFNPRQIFALGLLVVIVLAGSSRTWRRNRDWGNEDIFWHRTVAVAPDNIKAWLNIAYREFVRQRDEQAIAAWRQALRIDPDSQDALMNLGVALIRTNQNEEAASLYEKAIAQHPDRAAFHVDLALAEAALGKTDTVVREFRRAIELKPNEAVLHFNLGLALSSSGDPQSALAEYDTATKLKSDSAEAWNARGAVLIKLQRRDEARVALKRALELKPDYREAIFNLTLLDAPR